MIFLILVAIVLMMVVLVQSSKGGGLAGTFGGSDASMMFGVRRTADFMVRLTTGLATFLLVFSLVTNVIINKGPGTQESIIQQNSGPQTFPQEQVPNVPQQNEQQPPQENQPQENQQPQDQNQPNNQVPGDQQPPK
jgi:preprotein translocase subunit SecG